MHIIIYITGVLLICYIVLMILYRWGWANEPAFVCPNSYVPATKISVIIPARNEENHITACIKSVLNQDYPATLLEVIVVDDHSTDNTADLVRSFDSVKYINLAEHMTNDAHVVAYKKLALATGIEQCSGELIVTTDADCIAGRYWLKEIAAKFEQEKAVMVVAPVQFTSDNSIVQVFQQLDFMSMQGITAATLRLKLGNMCNGANLAFSKQAYEQVGGYTGIDHIASGDDYLLMMKLSKAFPGGITYLKSKEAIVSTPPQTGWMSFLNQRIRWASKSGKYDDSKMTAVLGMVYLLNVSLFILLISGLFYPIYLIWFAAALFTKVVFELIYLLPVAWFFNNRKRLLLFPLLQPLHIMYIVLAGFLGFVGVYRWKGRTVK